MTPKTERITWTNETRRLGDLVPWPRNPRQIKTEQAKRLRDSFERFGQVETIAVGPANEAGQHPVYNGHQRLNVLMQQHGADYTVEVRVASRALTEKERERLTVYLHKGAAGEWNFDELAAWDVPELVEWGFTPYELGIIGEGNDPGTEYQGMPEFGQDDLGAYKSLVVHFPNQDEVDRFADLIKQKITEKTKFIWFPQLEIIHNGAVVTIDES